MPLLHFAAVFDWRKCIDESALLQADGRSAFSPCPEPNAAHR